MLRISLLVTSPGIIATDPHFKDLEGHWLMHSSHPTIKVRCIPKGRGWVRSRKLMNLKVNRFFRSIQNLQQSKDCFCVRLNIFLVEACGNFALIFL